MWFKKLFKKRQDPKEVNSLINLIENNAIKRRIIKDYFTDRIKEVYGGCCNVNDFIPSDELIEKKYLYGKHFIGDKQFMIHLGIMEKYFDILKQEMNAEESNK